MLMSLSASHAASLLLLGLLSASASGWCSRLRLKQDCLLRSWGPGSLTAEAVRELDRGLEDTWRETCIRCQYLIIIPTLTSQHLRHWPVSCWYWLLV